MEQQKDCVGIVLRHYGENPPEGIQCKISKRNKSAGRYGTYMARPNSAEKDGK
jgi:hypothetical protein